MMIQTEFRDVLFSEIQNLARKDKHVMVLTADMGAFELTHFKELFKTQFLNVAIAEQSGVSIAAGLALEGKKVFLYGITPFITLRCFEQIKVDLCTMKLPVTIIGIGAGYAYSFDGPTHHAIEDIAVMRALPEMTVLCPSDPVSVEQLTKLAYEKPGPKYIRLDKGSYPTLYEESHDFSRGLAVHGEGNITIISTGTMVHKALKVSNALAKRSISCRVVDLYRIKPITDYTLLCAINESELIVTLEDHLVNGGVGSMVSEVLADNHMCILLKRIGVKDQYSLEYGSVEKLHSRQGLDVDTVTKVICKELYS